MLDPHPHIRPAKQVDRPHIIHDRRTGRFVFKHPHKQDRYLGGGVRLAAGPVRRWHDEWRIEDYG